MQVMEKNLASGSTDQTERRWSYTSGTSDTPLLGLTIGDLFDQTVEKCPAHLEVLGIFRVVIKVVRGLHNLGAQLISRARDTHFLVIESFRFNSIQHPHAKR